MSIDSRHLRWFFRCDGLCVLAKPGYSFQIFQSCLEEWDKRWLDLNAVLLFQMFRQLHSRNITDFRNSISEKFHRFHQHPPGDLLEPGMYRQAGRSVFNGGRLAWTNGTYNENANACPIAPFGIVPNPVIIARPVPGVPLPTDHVGHRNAERTRRIESWLKLTLPRICWWSSTIKKQRS